MQKFDNENCKLYNGLYCEGNPSACFEPCDLGFSLCVSGITKNAEYYEPNREKNKNNSIFLVILLILATALEPSD